MTSRATKILSASPWSTARASIDSDSLGSWRRHAHALDDLDLLGRGGVVDDDLHQEAVALRLGQRVHALLLDRVLGGEHQERLWDGEGLAADAHLVLGHDLEQRRLHLGGGPVDLVGEHEVGEDRAELDVERARCWTGRSGCP